MTHDDDMIRQIKAKEAAGCRGDSQQARAAYQVVDQVEGLAARLREADPWGAALHVPS